MEFESLIGLPVYPRSVVEVDGTSYFIARSGEGKRLGVWGDSDRFEDAEPVEGGGALCPLTARNAAVLRKMLPWLRPRTLGLSKSVGCGDRLGLATPGHIQAIRQIGSMAPIVAQQSMRENARTGRSPQQVVDDAIWGVIQEGWREPWGADADHLKTTADVDRCVAAGYTFFTVDPGDHVDNEAHSASPGVLQEKFTALPWDDLEDSAGDMEARYLGKRFAVEEFSLEFDRGSLLRAACKYGRAIAHTAWMYRHLETAAKAVPFELEVSVDETETPTSPLEHYFVTTELHRLGVRWVSLAPRYSGRFEKGVDYIGDLRQFEDEFAKHAAIARECGPYKLSLHSGSDKFSIYPIIARHAGDLVHVKTAGTSYLEALRAVAITTPALFRSIFALAVERYPVDRATYHVSADLAKVAPPAALADEQLAAVLDSFDARQVLHVTFGSVLDRFGAQVMDVLVEHEEEHYAALASHFVKHLEPFMDKE